MILGIDTGNTNIVYGRIDINGEYQTERILTKLESVDEIVKYYYENKYEGAILSSVVPAITDAFREKLPGIKIVSPDMNMSITIGIDDPYELGQDLIVGAEAAVNEYSLPVAIIDMGTASTIFVVDKDKVFRGGTIHPGMGIELKSLDKCTALLPGISFEAPDKVFGTNTHDCILSGVLYGHAGMIDGILDNMENELGYKLNCIATGGLAKFIQPLTRRKIGIDDNLILKGLYILYQKN